MFGSAAVLSGLGTVVFGAEALTFEFGAVLALPGAVLARPGAVYAVLGAGTSELGTAGPVDAVAAFWLAVGRVTGVSGASGSGANEYVGGDKRAEDDGT